MAAKSGLALVFLLALVCGPVQATHFAYGTYYWTRTPGQTHQFTFTMESAYRLDFGWSPKPSKGPPPNAVGVGSVYIKTGTGGGCTYSGCGTNVLSYSASLRVSEVYSTANWFSGLYTWTSNLPNLDTKFLYFSICCRLSNLRDNNRDKTALIIAKMDPREASSPRTTGMPREYFEVNKPVSYRIPGLSPQGYTLTYQTSPSSESYLTGSIIPLGGSPTFSLNGNTGEVRWTPTAVGLYAYSCRVSDGKSVVPLDFIFEVLTSCGSNPNCNRPPEVKTDPVATNSKITFYRGVQKKITVYSTDPDTQDTTTVLNTQLPSGATFNFISRSGSRSNYEFSWVPPLDAVSWDVCYKAQDSRGMFSLGNFCVTKEIGFASIIYVSGIIRNFPINTPRHADFAKTTTGDNTAATQFLQTTLPSTAKPLLDMGKAPTTINKVQSSFDQWWNTGSGNREMVYSLTLSNGTRADGRIFTFSTDSFWPVDGELYGESVPTTPNRYFTYEIHTYLTYKGGEVFQFMSSDDLWVYIDNKLPPNWNLAGVHPVQTYSVTMNTLASAWGLHIGETYRVDIFFAHRHSTRAPYLQIELPEAVLCNALQSGVVALNVPVGGFSASTPLVHLGKSRVSGGLLQPINNGAPSDSGAAWLAESVNGVMTAVRHKILHGFEATFSFTTSGASAEGFAFVLQGASPGARGSEGGGMGYSTIARSVAVEFDMFRSPEYGDPNFQHVSIHTRYADHNDANEAHSIGRSNNDPPMTMNNGTVHNIRIEYTPAREEASNPNAPLFGWIRVYMNTVLKPVVEAQIDGRQLNTMFGGAAFVGFTSANSDARVATYNIRDFKLSLVPASAAESSLLASPATIGAGQTGSVILQMRDSCANTIRVGGEAAKITGTIRRASGTSPSTINVAVADNNDGTYTLSYVVPYTGLMTFEIRFGGQRVKNAPYTFSVALGATDASRSEWVYSYPPLSVSSDNSPQPDGLFVAELDAATGQPISTGVYDLTRTTPAAGYAGGASQLNTFINTRPSGRVIAVAIDTSFTPSVASAATALSTIGCTLTGVVSGNSFVCIGIKGTSTIASDCTRDLDNSLISSQSCRQLNTGDTTGLIRKNVGGRFTVWAQSWGSSWGSGAYIYSVPNNYVAYAGIDSTYTIIARDSLGYLKTEGADYFSAAFQPDITASGGNVTVAPATPGYYDVTFTSKRAGSFQMYNRLTNVLIGTTGLPSAVEIRAGRAVAASSSIAGAGAVTAVAGVEAVFEVHLFDAFGNAVEQESPLDTVTAELTRTDTPGNNPVFAWDGAVLKGKYTRTVAGEYTLRVTINDESDTHLELTVTVTPGVVHRAHCVATDADGVAIHGSTVQAGTVVNFYIQSKDAYDNNVTIPIPGTTTFTISFDKTVENDEVLYDGNGRYVARYTPRSTGTYALTIQLPGAYPDPGHIKGSSFSINVIPGPAAIQSELLSVPSTVVAGEEGTLQIHSRDRMSNNRNRASEPSAYTVLLRSNLLSVEGTVAPSVSSSFHLYTARYTLTKIGTYEVNVRLAAGGDPITNSPGSTTVVPAATDRLKCVVSGAGANGGVEGDPATFQVQARDSFDNNRPGTNEEFRLSINDGSPILATAAGNGVYTFTYTVPDLQDPGSTNENFKLVVEFKEGSTWKHVYTNNVAQTTKNLDASYAVPSSSSTADAPLPKFKCGEPSAFFILDRSRQGPLELRSTFFTATMSDASGIVPGVTVSPINPPEPRSHYIATFLPTRAGTYDLNIFWLGIVSAEGGPWTVEFVPGAVSPAQSQVFNLPATGEAGVFGQFSVELRDQYGQVIKTGDQQVSAKFTASGDRTLPDIIGVWNVGSSRFVFNYNITVAATWTVSIYDSTLPNQNLGGSSRTLTITPAAPHAASSLARDTGLSVTAGVPATFDVEVRDRFGNRIDSNALGSSLSCALVDGASTTCATDPGPVYRVGTGGLWRMTYTTTKSRPATAGAYALHVRFGGVGIGASPYPVVVSPAALDPVKSTVVGQNPGTAGQPLTLTLQLKDTYGNEWRVENRLIRAFATHTVTSKQATAGIYVNTSAPYSHYHITLDGGDTEDAGDYSWRVTASAVPFNPTGLGLHLVRPGPVDVSKTAILRRPAETLLAGDTIPEPVRFQLRDAFNNDVTSGSHELRVGFLAGAIACLTEASQNETAVQLPVAHRFKAVDVTDAGAGRYDVSFYPEETGRFTMNVSINGVEISCETQLNLVFSVTPGAPSAEHSTFTALVNTTAGTLQEFIVTARDVFGNPASSPLPPKNNTITVALSPTPTGPWTWSLAELTPPGPSAYKLGLTVFKAGTYTVTVYLDGDVLPMASQIIITPGTAFSASFPSASEFAGATAGEPFHFYLQGADRYGNPITTTQHTYTVEFKGYARVATSSSNYDFFAAVTPDLNGKHKISFTSAWSGNFTVTAQLFNELGESVASTFRTVYVNPATCAAKNPATPYRCRDGTTCAASYAACPDINVCPSATPNRCATDPDLCVAFIRDCPCPTGQIHCANTGSCVMNSTTVCLQTQPCPAGTLQCKENNVWTGQCRANLADCPARVVCTPGYVLCPSGSQCARDLASCEDQAYVGVDCSSPGFLRCPSGQCVETLNDCPTSKSCPAGQVLCASDGSCRTAATLCPQQYDCYDPTPFCCADGSCRANSEQCPSPAVCPVGWVLCENGQCAKAGSECHATFKCPADEVRCPDGSCRPNTLFCPSVQSCPADKPVLCGDGSCDASVFLCSAPRVCPTDTQVCPDGSCVSRATDCPTTKTCPPSAPLMCADKNCVSNMTQCATVPPCPLSAPVRCPDGSCRTQLTNCPSQTSCPPTQPVKCQDGSCMMAESLCPNATLLSCPVGQARCPGGECAASLSHCPTHVTCPLGSKKCIDGTCRDDCEGVVVKQCASGLITCPQAGGGVFCAVSLDLCPQSVVCPANRPVKCIDASCAATVSDCPPVRTDFIDYVACSDGTWKADTTLCGSGVRCPDTHPFKCFDQTCRSAPEDCPAPPRCPPNTPYLCPNSKCVDRLWDTQCASPVTPCKKEYFVRCPAEDRCYCPAPCRETPPPDDSDFPAYPTSCSVNPYNKTEIAQDELCPVSYTRCRDGSCAESATLCKPKACPFHLPHLCVDGLCVKEASMCNLNNGCPFDMPIRCPDSGVCRPSLRDCPTENVPKCPEAGRTTRCSDGSCAPQASDCPNANGCQRGEIRCHDKTCVRAPDSPDLPAEQSECNAGHGTANACPPSRPFQCANGYCALSSILCPVLDFPCPKERPAQCADGSCRASLEQCAVVQPVNPGRTFRCPDGSIRNDPLACPQYNTCPRIGNSTWHRCDNGLCAPTANDCLIDETGCPKNAPHKCSNGACVASSTSCAAVTFEPNGCPNLTPVKCLDGKCVVNSAECPLSNGCPRTTPFKCAYRGLCSASLAGCPTEVCPATQITCADGKCVAKASDCKASNGCPVTKPVLCGDGSCATSAQSCPAVVTCNQGQTLCYDGSCVVDAKSCRPRVPCPLSTPFKCGDGSCKATAAECNVCPSTAPVRCASGVCKAKLSECPSSAVAPPPNAESTCTDASKPVLCFDGSCRRSYSDCMEWQKAIGADTGSTSGCPTDQVLCPNGACATSVSECQVVARCPFSRPLRCWDGTCLEATATCPEETVSCQEGTRRCEDGSCRATCLQYDGCGLDTPYHCRNRECARTSDDCVAAEKFDESLTRGRPIVVSARRLLEDKSGPNSEGYDPTLPHICYDNCKSMLKAVPVTAAVDPRYTTEIDLVVDGARERQAWIVVPSGALVSNTSAQPVLYVRPVGESRMRTMVSRVTRSRRVEFGTYFTLPQTLLSPAFEIAVDADTIVPFDIPITVAAAIDLNRSPLYKDVCLAYEYTIPDVEFHAWKCLYSAETARSSNPVRSVETNATEPVQIVKANIYRPDGLVYAFVHAPAAHPAPPVDYSDWWADNLIWIVLGLCGGGIFIGGVFYYMQRLHRYRKKYKETGKQVEQMQAEVEEMEQFGGSSGTKDEAVEMMANPLMVQMRDIQARLDRKNKEVLEEEEELREKQSEARQEHITNLQSDRDRLAAELEELRAQLSAASGPALTPVVPEPVSTSSSSGGKKPKKAVRANFDAQPPAQRRKKQVD